MHTLWQDLCYGARMMLRQSPVVTAVAVLSLALGIGANTAIFSVVHGVLLRPLPYPDPERLAILWEGRHDIVRGQNFLAWHFNSRSFEALCAYQDEVRILTGEKEPDELRVRQVSERYFAVLAGEPAVGRRFRPDDIATAILSHGLWRRQFGGDPQVVGRSIRLGGESYAVVGVMPAWWTHRADVWTPLRPAPDQKLFVLGRLRRGVTVEQAHAEMQSFGAVTVTPYLEEMVGRTRTLLLLLAGAVGFVLLIAGANVANLLLARGLSRTRELAIRSALGASRARLLRQLLTESVLLALGGGAIGALVALWGGDALRAVLPSEIPRRAEIRVDAWVFGFTALVSVLSGALFGLAPALQLSRPDRTGSLKGRASQRWQTLLVGAQLAIAVVLLAGAGLMLNSLLRLHAIDPGFRPDRVLTLRVALPQGTPVAPFLEQVLPRVQALPGVEFASAASSLPFGGLWTHRLFTREERSTGGGITMAVTPGYFQAVGIPLRRGRYLLPQDREGAILNEVAAARFWAGQNPIGKRFKWGRLADPGRWFTVVGVVGAVKQKELPDPLEPEVYTLYDRPLDLGASIGLSVNLVVRTTGHPMLLAPSVKREVWVVGPNQPITRVATLQQLLAGSVAPTRFRTLLMGILAMLGLLLAAIGVYSAIYFAVSRRTQEIGIRMALGAGRRNVLALVMRRWLVVSLAGVAVGTAGAVAATRLIGTWLYGVTPTDPATLAGVGVVLLAVAALAVYLPARRAARVDPLEALRHE